MHLGGVARSAGGAERSSRGREGEKFLIFTGPEGKPGGASRFPLSLKTDGVFNTKLSTKKVRREHQELSRRPGQGYWRRGTAEALAGSKISGEPGSNPS